MSEEGVFDFNAYQEAIGSPEAANFFAAMRQQVAGIVPVEKLQQKVIATAQVSDSELRAEFIRNNTIYDLDYLLVRSSLWKNDEIVISDEELKSYYGENIEQIGGNFNLIRNDGSTIVGSMILNNTDTSDLSAFTSGTISGFDWGYWAEGDVSTNPRGAWITPQNGIAKRRQKLFFPMLRAMSLPVIAELCMEQSMILL